jgi:hypothetical protein
VVLYIYIYKTISGLAFVLDLRTRPKGRRSAAEPSEVELVLGAYHPREDTKYPFLLDIGGRLQKKKHFVPLPAPVAVSQRAKVKKKKEFLSWGLPHSSFSYAEGCKL